MKHLIPLIIFVFLFCSSHTLWAYSSITVPIDAPVYRKLDKLAAHGLIKTMLKGQRPYVRQEIARLIAEAMKNYPDFEVRYRKAPNLSLKKSEKRLRAKIYVDRILRELKLYYRDELIQREVLPGKVPRFQGAPLEYIQFDYLYLDEDKRTVPPNNGLGGINAFIQPLVENREGRHYQKGHNWSFETQHWARLGKYFSIQVQPRFQMQIAKGPRQDENKAFIHRLNGRFTYNKFDLEIGRDSINWGPSGRGGLTFSSNPRPLDFIKASSISPFRYPFFFRKLGINQMSLIAANLGPQQRFKNPWLIAYKISNMGHPFLEFGFTQTLVMGGEGAPKVGIGEGFLDFFNSTKNNEKEYRNISFELIGHIAPLRGMEIYTEINFSDLTSNMNTLWVYNASYLAGVYLPRLDYVGNLDLRLEYRRLGARYARSPLFTDGMTENRYLIGDALGPDSYGIFLELHYDFNPKNLFSFSFQYSHFNNNLYQFEGKSIKKIADLGNEDRWRYAIAWRHLFNRRLVGRVGFGIEQVKNLNFSSGNDQVNFLGEIGFRVYLFPHFDSQLFR